MTLFVAFGVVAAVAAAVGYVLDKKRREELMRFALSKGWRYLPSDDRLIMLAEGAPFGQGDHRRARNVLYGSAGGFELTAFDYSFQTHSSDGKGGRTTSTHNYGVCAIHLPAYLPTVQVTHESLLDRAAGLLGAQDIELESDEFNRRFRVQAGNRKLACDVLSPRTMQALLGGPRVDWRIEGPVILAWWSGRLKPLGVLASSAVLTTVISGVPSFVWRDYGADPAAERSHG